VWALSRLLSPDEFDAVRDIRLPRELDVDVRTEWTA